MRWRRYHPKHAHRHEWAFSGATPFADVFRCRCGERYDWEADR